MANIADTQIFIKGEASNIDALYNDLLVLKKPYTQLADALEIPQNADFFFSGNRGGELLDMYRDETTIDIFFADAWQERVWPIYALAYEYNCTPYFKCIEIGGGYYVTDDDEDVWSEKTLVVPSDGCEIETELTDLQEISQQIFNVQDYSELCQKFEDKTPEIIPIAIKKDYRELKPYGRLLGKLFTVYERFPERTKKAVREIIYNYSPDEVKSIYSHLENASKDEISRKYAEILIQHEI